MANYLTVVVPRRQEKRLLHWLAPSGFPDAEHVCIPIHGTGLRLHHIGRNAPADLVDLPRRHSFGLFRGLGDDEFAHRLVYGARGAQEFLDRHAGRRLPDVGAWATTNAHAWTGNYASHWVEGRTLHSSGDFFRFLPLLYTSGRGMVAFSDSWHVLVRLRQAMGLTVTVDRQEAVGMATDRSATLNPSGEETLCHEVRLALPGTRLTTRLRRTGCAAPVPVRTPFAEQLSVEGDQDWAGLVRAATGHVVGSLRAAARHPGVGLRLSMSGGGDSRAVFAAMRRADPHTERSTFTSSSSTAPLAALDRTIAQEVCESQGVSLGPNPRAPEFVRTRYRNPMAVWYLSGMGLHAHIQTYPSFSGTPGSLSLTGHGVNAFKVSYGRRTTRALADGLAAFDPVNGAVFGERLVETCRRFGVGPDHPDGSEVAYFLTRGPLHAGRYTATSLLSAPPLAQRRFMATIYAPADSPRALPRRLRRTSAASQPRINSGIAHVVTCMLLPETARIRYDKPRKDVDEERLKIILDEVGGPLRDEEIPHVEAYGTPDDVTSGIAETLLRLVEAWGMDVQPVPAEMLDLVDRAERVVRANGLAETYAPLLEQATRDLVAGKRPGSIRPLGKILTFLAFEDPDRRGRPTLRERLSRQPRRQPRRDLLAAA